MGSRGWDVSDGNVPCSSWFCGTHGVLTVWQDIRRILNDVLCSLGSESRCAKCRRGIRHFPSASPMGREDKL